jgi:hypothetical protein
MQMYPPHTAEHIMRPIETIEQSTGVIEVRIEKQRDCVPGANHPMGHDIESFFAVMIWIAALDYENEAVFQAKPLVVLDKTKAPTDITYAG